MRHLPVRAQIPTPPRPPGGMPYVLHTVCREEVGDAAPAHHSRAFRCHLAGAPGPGPPPKIIRVDQVPPSTTFGAPACPVRSLKCRSRSGPGAASPGRVTSFWGREVSALPLLRRHRGRLRGRVAAVGSTQAHREAHRPPTLFRSLPRRSLSPTGPGPRRPPRRSGRSPGRGGPSPGRSTRPSSPGPPPPPGSSTPGRSPPHSRPLPSGGRAGGGCSVAYPRPPTHPQIVSCQCIPTFRVLVTMFHKFPTS